MIVKQHILKEVGVILSFILLCLAGVAGIPSWPKSGSSVGYFKVSKNPYGVAIFQDGQHTNFQFTNALGYVIYGQAVTMTYPKNTENFMTYSRDDIIFDTKGSIYTEPTQEQIDYLTHALGIAMTKISTSERRIELPVKTFYLVNPHIPGMVELRVSHESLWIDRDQNIIGDLTPVDMITAVVHDRIAL